MSLRIWLPLNGDLRNLGTSSGNFSIQTALTYVNNGKIGKAYSGGTITMDAATTASILNNQGFSWCCWIYVNSEKDNTTNRAMFFGNDSVRRFSIFQYPNCNDLHISWRNNDNTSVSVNKTWNNVLPSFQWTHAAITYTPGQAKLYINGNFVSSANGTVSVDNYAAVTYLFQNAANQTRYLNDYRIYDHCLSAAEVKEIAQGLAVHYKLNDLFAPAIEDLGIDTTIITDSSGYGYNGTITGKIINQEDSPRYNSSVYLNGSSYISTAESSMNWYQMDCGTLACWIKPMANVSNWTGSFGICQDGSSGLKGFSITDYANSFRVGYNNGSFSTVDSGKSLPVGEWHHCAATLDNTTLKMYFDGELVKTTTIDWKTATMPTKARIELGIDFPGSDEIFTGNYSDARFYVTPLLDKDIKLLYNLGSRIDNLGKLHTFEFKEATSEKLFKSGILQTNELEETTTQLAKLKNNKGWLSPEFIEI